MSEDVNQPILFYFKNFEVHNIKFSRMIPCKIAFMLSKLTDFSTKKDKQHYVGTCIMKLLKNAICMLPHKHNLNFKRNLIVWPEPFSFLIFNLILALPFLVSFLLD